MLRKTSSIVAVAGLALSTFCVAVQAQEPQAGSYVLDSLTLENGEVLEEVKLAYTTYGNPEGEPVLLMHGTHGNGGKMLPDQFKEVLFAAGRALDAEKYFFIAPDALGTGESSKPSDGLKADFPTYNYHDMVNAQYELLTKHFEIDHLRLVFGYSMGGMMALDWAIMYPDFMDAVVPMAAFPGPMSGRNWALRKLLVDSIQRDPSYNDGNYTEPPRSFVEGRIWFSTANYLGERKFSAIGDTREAVDAMIDKRYEDTNVPDANDALYQWGASRDFDPVPGLESIEAHVLIINSDDDPRNPPVLDTLTSGLAKIAHGESFMIKGTDETTGHGTVMNFPELYEGKLAKWLSAVPHRD
ncbi:alpha/beta fold hydrolase [Granulosicoccus antarcticus]|uniref:Homoserine O-acetyltransferase n=1 Tax=Granulosicoccus antarcticus IMCC3135 TaxID=1192854 RepID=A0A2Z2P184_9GAMM|nr:alpha/beta fold hydrolase [Granulosicoccus antarcticus]ASJ73304.1 Homoserine O-acetyltransferase [Granulosicoccus antarcticus IMCC3135]